MTKYKSSEPKTCDFFPFDVTEYTRNWDQIKLHVVPDFCSAAVKTS